MDKAEQIAREDILSDIGREFMTGTFYEVWDVRLSHIFNKTNRKLNKSIKVQ